MRTVSAYSLRDGARHEYLVPSMSEAIAHSKATWSKQYDPVERRTVEGGLPILIQRKEPS